MALADVPVELVTRCQGDDPAAFDELFALIHEDLFRWIYSLVRNEEDAQEILQDCCLRIYRHLPRLKDRGRFAAWAGRLVVNQVNTWRVRAARTRLDALEEGIEVEESQLPLQGAAPASPRTAAARGEILEHVNEAIRQLPPRQRTAVLLFDVENWTIREIAEELGCSEGAVKFNIFQGRRKLRDLLTDFVDAQGRPQFDAAQ